MADTTKILFPAIALLVIGVFYALLPQNNVSGTTDIPNLNASGLSSAMQANTQNYACSGLLCGIPLLNTLEVMLNTIGGVLANVTLLISNPGAAVSPANLPSAITGLIVSVLILMGAMGYIEVTRS